MTEKDKYRIPDINEMILNDSLYQENKFLIIHSWSPTDPEYKKRLDYTIKLKDFIKKFHHLETKIETYCDQCEKERVFNSKKPVVHNEDWRKNNGGLGICSEGLVIFEFECTFNSLHRRFYIFRTSYDSIFKIGQHPTNTQPIIDTLKLDSINEELFPFELIEGTRGYLEKTAKQVLLSFDNGIYDGALVLLRRLVESLIIECFERHEIADTIKDPNGDFYQFKKLQELFSTEEKWNISRNGKRAILAIKKFGDLSAHNRRFNAIRKDLLGIKEDIRIILQELIALTNIK